jgi:GNAT superfamily N-acetyltransferase
VNPGEAMYFQHGPAITYRAMTMADLSRLPIRCQGSVPEIEARIRDLGTCAMLAFDGKQHIGQLQVRRYSPDCRSPNGLWDPLYWGDFGDGAPHLPGNTLSLFCYHVGQLDDTERRDSRYQGRGVGAQLLDELLGWATEREFDAVVAKAAPSERKVMAFMGGQPLGIYLDRGFEILSSWIDPQLQDVVRTKSIVPVDAESEVAARVSCCVKWL